MSSWLKQIFWRISLAMWSDECVREFFIFDDDCFFSRVSFSRICVGGRGIEWTYAWRWSILPASGCRRAIRQRCAECRSTSRWTSHLGWQLIAFPLRKHERTTFLDVFRRQNVECQNIESTKCQKKRRNFEKIRRWKNEFSNRRNDEKSKCRINDMSKR